MAPLVRRSWAPRGCTPALYQRTRSHKKVSAIAALCINGDGRNPSLYFRLFADISIDTPLVIDFLKALLRQLRGPIVLIWDRLNAHRSGQTKLFLHTHRHRIHRYLLPPYAPELNPVEQVWGYLKMNPMANFAIHDVRALATQTRRYAKSVQRRPNLLRSFLKHTPLSFCP